jgi:predicted TIM-barrel fold metal-dependent hydrolase
MPNRQVIDIHCHLFNAQYAIMELTAATWNNIWGNYPHKKSAVKKKAVRGVIETLQGVKEFAAWIARFADVALSDCEGNYNTALEKFTKSSLGKSSSLIMAPLMMDIYFALDDNKNEEEPKRKGRQAAPIVEAFNIAEEQKTAFENHFDHIKTIISEEFNKLPAIKRRSPGLTLESIFQDARQELLSTPKKTRKGLDYEGIELSPGYKKHMHDLEALCGKYPNLVFPFLAVDPRRIGIMKLIEMKINKGKGVFKGIKLYPPLGYLPTHPNLEAIFDYCSKYDIPVTLHCSEGGMQNFRNKNYVKSREGNNHLEDFKSSGGNKSRFYTAPEKWLPVLKKWPDLRINFAHFGGGDKLDSGDTGWADAILKMIQDHPRVFTDVSYYSKPGLPEKISGIVNKNKILNTRLMFGTDYIMIMMDKDLGGLGKYFDHFTALNNQLLGENAKAFLKI